MITFLGDVALITNDLKSEYKPNNPYVFNLEYVVEDNNHKFLPTLGKINLSSQNHAFENIFGTIPLAVTVANNHIYDFGEEGFRFTISKMKELGIITVSDEPVFINDKVCLVSYVLVDKNTLFQFDYKKAKDNIFKIREKNPNVRIIVQMHWWIENSFMPNEEQKK